MIPMGIQVWFIDYDELYEGKSVTYRYEPQRLFGDKVGYYVVDVVKNVVRSKYRSGLDQGCGRKVYENDIFTSLDEALVALCKRNVERENKVIADHQRVIDRCKKNIEECKAQIEKLREAERGEQPMIEQGTTVWFIVYDALYEGECSSYVSKPNPYYGDATPFYIIETVRTIIPSKMGLIVRPGEYCNVRTKDVFLSLDLAHASLCRYMIERQKSLIDEHQRYIDRCKESIKEYEARLKEIQDEA